MNVKTIVGDSGTAWSYDPSRRIGDPGGMGEVFRGSDPTGAAVAIKRVTLRFSTEADRRRREREVEIAAVLALIPSQYTTPTLDVARDGDDLFMVMPLARRSLAAAIKAGDLNEAARLDALLQVANGLVELAAASVLHRDLKPANVLEHDGRWQLADFGLARNLQEATGTYTFLGAGTYPYMAPELWAGQPATVRSDLYAFGVMAYEVLTGSRPFAGPDEAAYRHQHQFDTPSSPPGAPPVVQRLVLRLLAKSPSDRSPDARAVEEQLRRTASQLTPVQTIIAERVVEHSAQRAREAAENATSLAEKESNRQRVRQAMADLKEIMDDSLDQLQPVEPDARLDGPAKLGWFPAVLTLSSSDASVGIELWDETQERIPDDTMVLAGELNINSRYDQRPRLVANVAYELVAGRLKWKVYQFVMGSPQYDYGASGTVARPRAYKYGPSDRAHGLGAQTFLDPRERSMMIHPVSQHAWTLTTRILTDDIVLALFSQALALSAPDQGP